MRLGGRWWTLNLPSDAWTQNSERQIMDNTTPCSLRKSSIPKRAWGKPIVQIRDFCAEEILQARRDDDCSTTFGTIGCYVGQLETTLCLSIIAVIEIDTLIKSLHISHALYQWFQIRNGYIATLPFEVAIVLVFVGMYWSSLDAAHDPSWSIHPTCWWIGAWCSLTSK